MYVGSTIDIFGDNDQKFTGLLFQDKLMKVNFAAYTEVLCVDATYKLTELCMPVYLMLTIDGNGQNDIVTVFITANETKVAIMKMIESFKAANPL